MSVAEGNQVVLKLVELERMLDAAATDLHTADLAAIYTRRDYLKAYATAFLNADGPMDVRKQLAIVASLDQWLAAEVADEAVRALKERIRTLGSRIDIGRSENANHIAAMRLAGVS